MTAVLQWQGRQDILQPLAVGHATVGRGWQRAIAQAQGSAWFQGPLTAGGGSGATPIDGADAPAAAGPASTVAAMVASSRPTLDAGGADVQVAAASRVAIAAKSPGPHGVASTPPLSEQGAVSTTTMDCSCAPVGRPFATAACSEQDTHPTVAQARDRQVAPEHPVPDPGAQVHVHVEQHVGGLHVWIGAPMASAAALARQLEVSGPRALSGRLAGVVCNGLPLVSSGLQRHATPCPGSAGHNQEP